MTTRGRFDAATITLHWLTVALFVPLISSVLLLTSGSGLDTTLLLDIHRGAGATLFAVTFARLCWRQTFARLPPFPGKMWRLHQLAVTGSEYALYTLLLAQPLTGLAMTLFRGRPFTLILWQVPALVARNKDLAAWLHGIHETGAYALLALVGGHAAAALIHHYLLRDDVLSAMLPLVQPRPRGEVQVVPLTGTARSI
jgi:cytochrome b561